MGILACYPFDFLDKRILTVSLDVVAIGDSENDGPSPSVKGRKCIRCSFRNEVYMKDLLSNVLLQIFGRFEETG